METREHDDSALEEIAQRLRQTTHASRVTIRGPEAPGEVGTTLLAESSASGVESMADAPQAGIAEAPTYVFLRTELRPLLQDDCRDDPLPPRMLTERYGVAAQMLGPLLHDGNLVGTVSVHEVGQARHWTSEDAAALDTAVGEVWEVWTSRLPN